jgi:hypothetical protein
MPPHQYEPIVADVTMSQYGYWVVELSVTPWQRMSVMICQVGISPDKARALALLSAAPAQAGM